MSRDHDTTPSSRAEPALPGEAAAALSLVHQLSAELSRATGLRPALATAGARLAHFLGASGFEILRVHDWNGNTALVGPWVTPAMGADDLIDVSQLFPTRSDDRPLGMALATLRCWQCDVPAPSSDRGWRAAGTRRVMAVPVVAHEAPVAVLEFYDVADGSPAVMQMIDVVAMQLGGVAQGEATRVDAASRAEHAGRLALVAARIAGGVAITDHGGTVQWVNPAFTEVTGLLATEVLGRPLPQVLGFGERGLNGRQELSSLFAAGTGFRFEYAGRHALDGTDYWGEIDALLMSEEPGARQEFVCLCNDVSERRRREVEISEGRDMMTALTENIPISLVVIDAVTLSVVSINRHAELEFGAQRDGAAGRSLDEVLGPGMRKQLANALAEAIQRQGPVEHDFVLPRLDGDRLLSARHVAVRNPHGNPRLLITQLRDNTERRRTEFNLMESELRYKQLIESMDDGVYVTTPERDRYYYVSDRTFEIFGFTQADLDRDVYTYRKRIHPDDEHLFRMREEQEHRFEPTDITFRIIDPRGTRWLRQRTRTRALQGGEVRVYALVSDVTGDREREMQLQAARDAAEAASQAKSQFLANMSHEIRTPMNGILGMTELLLGTQMSDRQRRFAQAVYRSGESLLEIINDILDFAKIEAGRLELALSEFAVRGVVEDTLELLAPRAHEKGLELSFREGPGLPTLVRGDPLRLRQVLTNLVANAIKFTDRGEVTVDLRWLPDEGPDGHPQLEFVVKDTGIGIAPQVVPTLFKAFTQGHVGMARRFGGTGLGLAISKQLVDLMGGQISVQSAPGIGSEFRFTVNVGLSNGIEPAAESMNMPALNALVVEDNPTNRDVLENMLTAWGMSVTLAVDGENALAQLRALDPQARRFDLALVDWHMPRLDGIEFARAVRAEGLQPDMKLVMLSSASRPDELRVAQDAGYVRFIHKPIRRTELRQALLGVAMPAPEQGEPLPRVDAQILVVEDNLINQEVMGQMLRRLGARVNVASSALEGLRAMTSYRFDLVLMDIQMPGMDGIEALNWFRRGPSGRFAFLTPADTPVVAVTANALEGDAERFLGLGFDDYLAKPFRQAQLVAVLGRHLRTRITKPTEIQGGHMQPKPDPAPATGAEAKPASPSASVLDAEALSRLRALDPTGQNQLLQRVLKAFEASIARLMPQLEEAVVLQDFDTIRHVTHTLKSSSASIGALKLSGLCADTESQVRQTGTVTDLASRVSALREEVSLVRASLHTLLDPSA